MNKVVKAENEKVAAVDFATATETQADGQRRAEIKKAEGIKQARILKAEGEAQAIQLVNEAADKYFIGNAQMLRKLEAVEKALCAERQGRRARRRGTDQRHRRDGRHHAGPGEAGGAGTAAAAQVADEIERGAGRAPEEAPGPPLVVSAQGRGLYRWCSMIELPSGSAKNAM